MSKQLSKDFLLIELKVVHWKFRLFALGARDIRVASEAAIDATQIPSRSQRCRMVASYEITINHIIIIFILMWAKVASWSS